MVKYKGTKIVWDDSNTESVIIAPIRRIGSRVKHRGKWHSGWWYGNRFKYVKGRRFGVAFVERLAMISRFRLFADGNNLRRSHDRD